MRTCKEIQDKLAEAQADERLKSPTATVFENAPLALIQFELETRIRILKWVLGE